MIDEYDLTKHTEEWEVFKSECAGAWENLSEECREKFAKIYGAEGIE